ncbi:hypothetical protein HBH56_084370 [Parastagonospora nodorum]|nr:hypothetical protein HBH56_084370 [Parastagonospora nodorum]KAH3955274.1 hypothetical protein HBH53_007110 [Parastagonospora nodorum]KAH3982349.1 hypothetical protein HBH52_080080 [Parastagonospora nodorum]KAH4058614.1 hypothetical protein HBH49_035430 [Parastagonospora nodorum]KAH4069273.1 hypothetical protein HBH50_111040 [Parastagonospora nodorum]
MPFLSLAHHLIKSKCSMLEIQYTLFKDSVALLQCIECGLHRFLTLTTFLSFCYTVQLVRTAVSALRVDVEI